MSNKQKNRRRVFPAQTPEPSFAPSQAGKLFLMGYSIDQEVVSLAEKNLPGVELFSNAMITGDLEQFSIITTYAFVLPHGRYYFSVMTAVSVFFDDEARKVSDDMGLPLTITGDDEHAEEIQLITHKIFLSKKDPGKEQPDVFAEVYTTVQNPEAANLKTFIQKKLPSLMMSLVQGDPSDAATV